MRVGNANLNEFILNVKVTRPKEETAATPGRAAHPGAGSSPPAEAQGPAAVTTKVDRHDVRRAQRLNPRDIGSWPVLPKLGALMLLILALAAGYWFDWSEQWTSSTPAQQGSDCAPRS